MVNLRPRRKKLSVVGIFFLFVATALTLIPSPARADDPYIMVLTVDNPIVPAVENYLDRGLEKADTDNVELVILQLDTPGGSIDSMQNIIQRILETDTPVVVFVSPRGAMAGSAGAIITLAGDKSAMAPETSIGAASPVNGDGSDLNETLDKKAKNILTAMARSLTENRSVEAQELAVRMITESDAVSSTEALEIGLIDYIATSNQDLISQLDGQTLQLNDKEVTLNLTGLDINVVEMNLIEQLLVILTDPTLVFTLLSVGVLLIVIELSHPGGWLAGTVGLSALVLSLYGIGVLPLNLLGLILVGAAIVMFVIEIQMPGTQGFLSIGAAVSLAAGGYILFSRPELEQYGAVPLAVILLESAMFGVIGAGLVYLAMQVRHKTPITGMVGMEGMVGTVRKALEPRGMIFVNGELWQAETTNGAYINEGEKVEIVTLDSLMAIVQPLDEDARRKGPPKPP